MPKRDIQNLLIVVCLWIISFSAGFILYSLPSPESSQTGTIYNASTVYAAESDNVSEAPNILGIEVPNETFYANASFKLSTDKALVEKETENYSLRLIEESKNQFRYLVTLDNLSEGENKLTLSLTDEVGNINNHQLTVNRMNISTCLQNPDRTVKETVFPFAIEVVVDKYNKLPDNFIPPVLINGSTRGLPVYKNGSAYVTPETFDALVEMIKDIQQQGISVVISSGYRSFSGQTKAHSYWSSLIGDKANYYAALPGFSEHHLGTTVDLLTVENNYTISDAYENTRLGKWLKENAYKYGFTMSYPKDKQHITGYRYEPWHWRYLGKEHAKIIEDLQITPTEYLYSLNRLSCE